MARTREQLGSTRGASRVVLAGLLAVALTLALSACGGSSSDSTTAGLKLEREDLAAACRALQSAKPAVAREVAATKAAWPLIANGIPADASSVSSAPSVQAAVAAAGALRPPPLFEEAQARTLTGSAAQLAGLFRSYVLLSSRGWKLLDASLAQMQVGTPGIGRPPSALFARENVGLYIESIYDGHFTLAQIGKKLRDAYKKLGGPGAFGAGLTQAEVDALAATYSEASDRLHPHVAVRVGS